MSASTNPIVRAAAHFAAAAVDANKAEIDALAASGIEVLVDDGSKLAEDAAAKLGPVVSGAIDGLIAQYAASGEAALDKLADAGVDELSAFLHDVAGDEPAAPAAP